MQGASSGGSIVVGSVVGSKATGLLLSPVLRSNGQSRAKYKFVGRTELTVGAWKGVFCALLMGATLPKQPQQSNGDLVGIITGDEKDLSAVYPKLKEAVDPLYKKLGRWHEYLITGYLDEHGYTGHGGKTYVKNEAGMTFCPGEVWFPYERKAKLASFLLQGREAAYIHPQAHDPVGGLRLHRAGE